MQERRAGIIVRKKREMTEENGKLLLVSLPVYIKAGPHSLVVLSWS